MTAPKEKCGPAQKGGLPEDVAAGEGDSAIPEPNDPFDTERLRSPALADIGVERATLTVPVRRPARTEFFRVHPDPSYSADWYVLERNNGVDRETYWVARELHAELLDDLRLVRIFECMNKHGTAFLWPAKLPTDSSIGRRWSDSALEIAEYAKYTWVKMIGKRDLGAYEMYKARGDLGEPVWPDKTLRELLRIGFKDRLIDSLNHPVLRELAGEL